MTFEKTSLVSFNAENSKSIALEDRCCHSMRFSFLNSTDMLRFKNRPQVIVDPFLGPSPPTFIQDSLKLQGCGWIAFPRGCNPGERRTRQPSLDTHLHARFSPMRLPGALHPVGCTELVWHSAWPPGLALADLLTIIRRILAPRYLHLAGSLHNARARCPAEAGCSSIALREAGRRFKHL